MGSRRLTFALIAGMSLVPPAASAAEDRVIATLPGPTPVEAYAGRVLWSEPAPQGYRLVSYVHGRATTLPIQPRTTPFDADLGPGPNGSPVAVYSRCGPHAGCDLYIFDFARRREVPVGSANSPFDETSPAIWRKRIAFVRTFGPKRKAVYWRPLRRSGRSHRLRPGPAYLPAIQDLDMRAGRVALLYGGEWGGGEVRLTSIAGRTRVLASVPASGGAAMQYDIFGVSLQPGFAYWALTQHYDIPESGQLDRRALAKGPRQQALIPVSPHTAGFAQDGGVSYQLLPHDESTCVFSVPCVGPYDLHRRTGLRFGRAAPLELRRSGAAPSLD
jgi:hypothetical protein